MKVQCDVCTAEAASVFCCADEAALCDACDRRVHRANKLAGKHRRFSLLHPCSSSSSSAAHKPPLCDICQERRGFLFCKEDRAILCRECDAPVHSASDMTRRHSRFLLTGVRLSSAPVDSAGPSEEEEQENSRGPCNDESCSSGSGAGGATTATASDGSSISEYLTKTLPGWHVEDFLIDDASAGDVGACSDGLYQLLKLAENIQKLKYKSSIACKALTKAFLRAPRTFCEEVWSCLGPPFVQSRRGQTRHTCRRRPFRRSSTPYLLYNLRYAS